MKNLDDLLKTKAAQAETDKKLKAQEEERTARENVEGSILSLETSKKQLSVVKESLSMEKEGRGKATRRKQSAESKIDSKVGDLEKFGISKEELLTSPDYSELEEVEEVKGANEEAEVFSAPSADSEALKSKLESLGIEVPADVNESDIDSLISKRMNSIDKELISKRLEIPGEKEKLVGEILEENKLLTNPKLDSLATYGTHPFIYNITQADVKKALEHLEPSLSGIAMLREYPELKAAAMERLMTEVILRQERAKSEKVKSERDKHEEWKQKGGLGDSADRLYPQTDFERYEIHKSGLKYYEDKAKEQGISLEELTENDTYANRGVPEHRSGVRSYEEKLHAPGKKLGEYLNVSHELRTTPRPEYGADSQSLKRQFESLTAATSKLVNFPNDLKVKFDADTYKRYGEVQFTIPSRIATREDMWAQREAVEGEIKALEANLTSLGNKPTGLFSGGAQKKWEAESSSIRLQIQRKESELNEYRSKAQGIEVGIQLGSLGNEIGKSLTENPEMTIAEIKELFKTTATGIEPKLSEAKEQEGKADVLEDRRKRLETERFEFNSR